MQLLRVLVDRKQRFAESAESSVTNCLPFLINLTKAVQDLSDDLFALSVCLYHIIQELSDIGVLLHDNPGTAWARQNEPCDSQRR